jgi:hypothetical protein
MEKNVSIFMSLLLQESFIKKLPIDIQPAAIFKRGVCTFVEKAKLAAQHGSQFGMVVNTENLLIDIPNGKEKTEGICTVPVGIMTSEDGQYLALAAKRNDIYFTIIPYYQNQYYHQEEEYLQSCERIHHVAEDLLDKWSHDHPPIAISDILKMKPPDQVRNPL